ncbi:helix-turn-helix domain-containing protein [Ancylobacter defluvii]|nr:helix-turn-helix domain-containing protein [Ancylobacter defluvii]MBS7586425.1 helix-turn-helix domain-containing protein [Ancylobacter defluvii]
MLLAETKGGTRVYVPKSPAGSELAALIGDEAAAKLSQRWPGEQIKIPVARDWRAAAYRLAGWTYDEIAVRLGIDRATVHRILQAQELVIRQLDLFRKD